LPIRETLQNRTQEHQVPEGQVPAGHSDDRGDAAPTVEHARTRWRFRLLPDRLSRIVVFLLGLFVAYAIAGVTLAVLGWFSPFPLLLFTAVLAVPMVLLARGAVPVRAVGQNPWPAVAALLIFATFAGMQFHYAAEHIVADRDPAVYLTTARHLARTGKLPLDMRSSVFTADPNIRFDAPGYFPSGPDTKLYPQFPHLLPVLIAPAAWTGHDSLLFKMDGLIAAFGLLVFYVFATRVVRPWFAVAAMAALAVNGVFVYFSRDTYSEIPTFVALFGALLLLWDARASFDWRRAALAGLLLGTATMARIDGFVYYTPLAVYLVIEAWRLRVAATDGKARRARVRFILAFAAGALATGAVGYIDVRWRSPYYFTTLSSEIREMMAALLLVVIGGAILVFLAPRLSRLRAAVRGRRVLLGNLGALFVLLVVVGFYWVRPLVQHPQLGTPSEALRQIQRIEGLTANGTTTFYEYMIRRVGWFVGTIPLFAAVIGLALCVRWTISRRATRLLPFLLMFGTITLLYLWDPKVFPDLMWVMRRYLPLTIPGIVLLATVLADAIVPAGARIRRAFPLARALAGTALALVIIVAPMLTLRDTLTTRAPSGLLPLTESICDRVGPKGAVALLPDVRRIPFGQATALSLLTSPTREFCGVDTAAIPDSFTQADLDAVRKRAEQQGKTLYLASYSPDEIRKFVPNADITEERARATELEYTLDTRPTRVRSYDYSVFLAPVRG
jgi:hypothetical protein